MGGTATGEISLLDGARDHDWFEVELEAGKTYRIEVRGSDTGNGTLADPVLVGMYDTDGKFIAGTGDDNRGTGDDSLKFFSPATSGTYYMAARAHGPETGTYTVAVREAPDDYAASIATTGTVEVGGSATGRIEYPHGDHDWFKVELEAGKTYRIDVKRSSDRDATVKTPVLVGIFDEDGQFIPGTYDEYGGMGNNAQKVFVPDTSGTFHVAVGAWRDWYTGTYTVAVEELPGDDYAASTATTGRVEVGGSATGEITQIVGGRDRDWLAVELEAGKTYRIDVKGSATGDGTLRDPWLFAIFNKYGGLRAYGDDNGGEGRNSRKDFVPDTSGTYYVEVRGIGYSYELNTGTYTVAVEEVPLPSDDYAASVATTGKVEVGGSVAGDIQWNGDRDWFAVDLEAGKTYRIEVKGSYTGHGTLKTSKLAGIYDKDGQFIDGTYDSGSGVAQNSLKDFTPDASGTYYVAAAGGVFTGTYTVAVDEIPEDDYAASVTTTGTVEVGGSATGELELSTTGRDQDWFAVELEAGKAYRIEVKGSATGDGTLVDPVLVGVFDKDGQGIAGTYDNDRGEGRNSLKVFTPDTSGTYYVAAGGTGNDPSIYAGTYRVVVTEVPDDYAASVATTGTVEVGGSVAGDIQWRGDRDWFAVELEAGKSYRIEVKGFDAGGGTLRSPYPELVGVYDKDGTYVAGTGNDDGGDEGWSSRKVFTPETSGTYHVSAGGRGFGTGTYTVAVEEVAEDDYAASSTLAVVEMGEVRVVEGGEATFTVRLSHASASDVTVEWSVGGTATAGDDYAGTGEATVLTFAAGETEKTVRVQTVDDTVDEQDETLTVTLSNPSGATLGPVFSATVTIEDNDEPPVPDDTAPQVPSDSGDTFFQGQGAPVGTTASETMDGTSGADAMDCLAGNDVARGLGGDDRLWGRQGADTLYGNAGNDRLWGGRDGDELHGGVGKDHLYGGLGHDTLYGGRGDDTLHGGRLADRLHGGEGKDVLAGGHGRDLFVYDDTDFGRDRIVDFEDGLDRLDFTGSGLRWSDLSVSNSGKGDAVVRVDGANGKIVLEGVDASLIDQNDFIF